MYDVMQKPDYIIQNVVGESEFDQGECEKLLETMVINQPNVLRYLKLRYVPTVTECGIVFHKQKCIQKALIVDGVVEVYIKKCEPHKVITDTIHVRNLLQEYGFVFTTQTRYFIDEVRLAIADTLLYNLLLQEFNFPISPIAKQYEQELLPKCILEDVIKIKKRSIKRKFLRYMVKKGQITLKDFANIIALSDYSSNNVKTVLEEIYASK
jgi:hypothetical protein